MGYELTFWTYIVTNAYKGTLYIGHTDDIYVRMTDHVSGKYEGFSKRYKLKHLVWRKEFESRDEAFKEERRLKNWHRDWKIELIEKDNPFWVDIHTAPIFPVPDRNFYPELCAQCLEHRLDPGVRRDERRYF